MYLCIVNKIFEIVMNNHTDGEADALLVSMSDVNPPPVGMR